MAYTEGSKDLGTFNSEEATRRGLTTLADPCLIDDDDDQFLHSDLGEHRRRERELKEEPHGPYRCPSCARETLVIQFRGWWD